MAIISIGEPWDFKSPDGENVMYGSILKVISSYCIVFKANYNLKFDQHAGDIFVLSPRHSCSNFDDLNNGTGFVNINGGLLLGVYDNKISENDLKLNSKFVIIGSLST